MTFKDFEKTNGGELTKIGVRFEIGDGMPVNYQEALRYYKIAADNGYDEANFYYGSMFYYGLGVHANYTKANNIFKNLAKKDMSMQCIIMHIIYNMD